jgi:hypothetical protein
VEATINSVQPTVVPVSAGGFSAGAPDLNAPNVREMDKLKYNPGETLFDFLKNNVASDRGKKEAFLTTADTGDWFVEFTLDQNNRPAHPRDPRYLFMTSQPYASSSYGLFQLTLLPFTPGPRVQLNQVFNPGYSTPSSCPIQNCATAVTPLYQLLTQPQTNFDLAGQFHRLSLQNLIGKAKLKDCRPNNCNTDVWQVQWTQIIHEFNPSGNGYGGFVSQIVNNGDAVYAPRNPSPQ